MADTNIIVTYESKETTHIVSMVITNNKKNWHHHDLWSIDTGHGHWHWYVDTDNNLTKWHNSI
jgi:hypothetical protein